MGEGFKKFKKKFLLNAIIKSAVCGLSFGLFAVGAVLLTLKLVGIPLQAGYYVLIALSAAILCGGISFLLFKPTDKKIAAKLDTKYALNERVQTALAYTDAEGTVVKMLQSDTDARLLSLPKAKIEFSKVWQYFLIALLAIALAVSAIIVPFKIVEGDTNGGGGEDAPYTFTDSQMDELQELIDNVQKSNLADILKTPTVESLKKLMNNLLFAESSGEMKSYVNNTIQSIENVIKRPLSYRTIANALGSVGQNGIAKMIADGVQVYKDYIIIEYDDVEIFYEERVDAVTEKTREELTEFFNSLTESEGNVSTEEGEEEDSAISIVVKTYGDIYTALNFSDAAEDDILRNVLYDFARGMAQSDNKLTNDTALYFDLKFNEELAEQSYLLAINKYITNTLRVIFSLDIPADENFIPTYNNAFNGNEEDDGIKQGGYGKGDMLYGSDDAVYDPSTGEYVEYGEIFNDYYAIVEALLREGNLTEEQQAVIRAYFEILLSGLKEEE